MDQDCVPHLFVDMLLRREHAVVWSVPGANLLGTDGAMREVDVLGLSHDKLFVAEVKTRSAEFTRPFTKNLATLARDVNADVLVLASLDDWTLDHQQAVLTWISRPPELLILSGKDMLAG